MQDFRQIFLCKGVTIVNHVFIGDGVTLISHSYPRPNTPTGRFEAEKDWKIDTTLVRRVASIDSAATILSTLVIGENVIVGAGSVVNRDVPANTIAAGNPAKLLRYIATELTAPNEHG